MFSFKKNWPEFISLDIDNKPVEVSLRIHPKAKHYRLSFSKTGQPVLTIPPFGNLSKGRDFLLRHQNWLEQKLKTLPKNILFVDGADILFRGEKHKLIMHDKIRGHVSVIEHEGGAALLVPGGEKHMQRRLKDWLKKQARVDLEKSVAIHANNLNVRPKSITIRSQSSRWGSCSSSARLNFNWRLILAPNFVLDYVAAHEVAHLVEMNHSRAFWAQVELTLPNMEKGKNWLKANGQELMIYG